MKKQQPSDYCMLWIKQNHDAARRAEDQKAFDALPEAFRAVVNDAPIEISCIHLLRGCRRFGAETMLEELSIEVNQWMTVWDATK